MEVKGVAKLLKSKEWGNKAMGTQSHGKTRHISLGSKLWGNTSVILEQIWLQSLSIYLLSTYHVSGNILGTGNTVLGIKMARQGPQFHKADILRHTKWQKYEYKCR